MTLKDYADELLVMGILVGALVGPALVGGVLDWLFPVYRIGFFTAVLLYAIELVVFGCAHAWPVARVK